MAIVFYLLGTIAVLVGGAWTAITIEAGRKTSAFTRGGEADGIALFATIVAATPGLSTLFAGLFLLAIGGGLARLDRIVRYSRQTALVMRDLQQGRKAE